jgi:arylsulfatase A-like enzyme
VKQTKLALLLLALALGAGCVSPSVGRSPSNNVVIIHVDDLGWRDLGCMGSPVYETPHIDALAASGTRYSSAYAAGSLCTPSRACMLTGSQPSRHGVYTVVKNRGKKEQWKVIPEKNNQFLPKEYPTIGTVLTDAGIANGAIGKWHIAVGSPSHGFAEGKWGGYLGMPINYFAPFELGFLPQDVPDGSYLPPHIREAGVAFLERHRDERFFLYFSTYLPHDEIKNEDGATLTAPEDVVRKYERKIAAMKKADKNLQGHTNAVYAAMIEETDRSVGAIIEKLDEFDLRENTLVLFISDNGGLDKYTSQRPLRGEKCTLYEGGIRVPMIASMPGRVAAGKVSDEPVSGIDFYPTICAFIGVKPTDPDKVDGEDLSDLIFHGKPLGERNLFWNFPSYNRPSDPARCPRSAMRRGEWKIHHRYEDNGYELYDLKEDIGESQDLAKSRPEILEMMRRELESCYDRFGAVETLPPNPEYAPDF